MSKAWEGGRNDVIARRFLRFIRPYEPSIYNLVRLHAGETDAADIAASCIGSIYARWKAARGQMTRMEVYKEMWKHLKAVPSRHGAEPCETGVAGCLFLLPPEGRILILFKDILGFDYEAIACILGIGRRDVLAGLNRARRRMLVREPRRKFRQLGAG